MTGIVTIAVSLFTAAVAWTVRAVYLRRKPDDPATSARVYGYIVNLWEQYRDRNLSFQGEDISVERKARAIVGFIYLAVARLTHGKDGDFTAWRRGCEASYGRNGVAEYIFLSVASVEGYHIHKQKELWEHVVYYLQSMKKIDEMPTGAESEIK